MACSAVTDRQFGVAKEGRPFPRVFSRGDPHVLLIRAQTFGHLSCDVFVGHIPHPGSISKQSRLASRTLRYLASWVQHLAAPNLILLILVLQLENGHPFHIIGSCLQVPVPFSRGERCPLPTHRGPAEKTADSPHAGPAKIPV